jgi:AcrR family transcriptional regulator
VRRTKEQAAETRQTILRTAEVLFLQRGYESSSLDEIAVAAGVSRGAIHFHFHNKLGLLFAFRDELILPMQQLAQRLGGEATLAPLDALGDVIETTFVELQGKPAKKPILKLLKAIDADEAYDDVSNARYFRQQVRLALTEICEAAQRNGALPAPWTARSAAIALYAMLDGLINEWFLDEVDLSLAPDGVAIIRSFLTSLTKPGRDLPAA